ncbi:major facilitator transporter [Microbacterium mangrovi]|uniref:Major facilitator transporter n=1 Tax=Microbacterium mangrovi TaxID=1348253 RepID=A0A0B2A795_9MICO|nr:MFS transporter [Microbacterium mangrovi]KHK97471.1 major facilitator transporter [Microbacterium mangrovi]
MPDQTATRRRSGWPVAALSLGTLLNPLNSSMIAVALVPLQHDLGVDVTTVTWVVTSFYLASAAGQPLMGRLGDRFGPRRLFLFGMIVVVVACVLTPFTDTLAGVCAGRVLLAIGTATAFPSAISMLRSIAATSGAGSARLLGRIQIANTSGAAIGPVVGGILVTLLGWQAIFWINVPLAAVTFVGVLLLAPPDPDREPTPLRRTLTESDIPGILLFIAMLTSLLVFLLELPREAMWWLLPAFAAAAGLFVWRELRAAHPFLDLRMLAGNRTLMLVYLCFAIFSVVYYSAFFGLPQYLQEGAGYPASAAGLLMFPLAAVTIVVTPLAARAIERFGLRPTLVTGAITLVVGAALLALAAVDTAPWLVLVVTAALGIPYCVVSIAMNQALYAAARPEDAGVAAGIYQTSRYLGAIVATTILGLLFSTGQTPGNWLIVVGVATALAVVHLGILVTVRPQRRTAS